FAGVKGSLAKEVLSGIREVWPTMRPSVVSKMACHAGPAGLFWTQCLNSLSGMRALVRRLYLKRICLFSESRNGLLTIRRSSIDCDALHESGLLIAGKNRGQKLFEAKPHLA